MPTLNFLNKNLACSRQWHVEDGEYVLFHCPEYDICRQEYPEIFLGTNMNMKNISDYDNQETIAQLLWNIRMTRIRLGVEC